MNFVLVMRNKGESKTWREGYRDDHILDLANARQVGERMIGFFNDTLRSAETERELVDVVAATAADHIVPTHEQRVRDEEAEDAAEMEEDEDEDEELEYDE